MTESYLKNITPDSLSGLILGYEGIRNALVILNGPTGCKFYHSITAETQSLHKEDYDPLNYPEEWFFGQRRVPCTYLDKRDYVYGSEGKLGDAIRFILGKLSPDALIVINSPGAALIGDDLDRIAGDALRSCGKSDLPLITCQSPGYSRDVIEGYREACHLAIDRFCSISDDPERDSQDSLDSLDNQENQDEGNEATVNLLGLSIYQKYHAGDVAEIKKLLGLCGIKVNTSLLCESKLSEIRCIPKADLNVVIDSDWALDSAEYLKELYGTPYVQSEYGYPVGFKAMEKLIREITGKTLTDPKPALIELEKARAKAYLHIARMSSLTGLPKGAHFMVCGTPAMKKGYSAFLTEYLGMSEDENDPEVVLADGNTIAIMKAEGRRISGIEISLPSIGYIDVIDKTHLGAAGGLFMIEQILNSFIY